MWAAAHHDNPGALELETGNEGNHSQRQLHTHTYETSSGGFFAYCTTIEAAEPLKFLLLVC